MKAAVVLTSGGLDSLACAYWARPHFDKLYALAFDYGQVNRTELEAAQRTAFMAGVDTFQTLRLDAFNWAKDCSLLDAGVEETVDSHIVPCRNLIFLATAAGRAQQLKANAVIFGANASDWAPDSQADFVKVAREAIAYSLLFDFELLTPLIDLRKSGVVKLLWEHGAQAAVRETVTCYAGSRPGCGACRACLVRAEGFAEAGLADPQFAP